MNFEEYIQKMKQHYKIVKVDDNSYMLHKDKKTLLLTPLNMYTMDEISNKLDLLYPAVEKKPVEFAKIKGECSKKIGSFGYVGEDDLNPAIGRKFHRQKRGAIFNPKDFLEEEESDKGIDKTDIFPLKNKKDPDPDHFKPQGGDDDNPFLY
ncbi:hypothetical protein NCER_101259 [Vairimorpha ceranae BRL01]|uniref:Uncharacterized protein n=1 Tax=Vairimorpha ceranae (strain BRL01) TaxID=578460 RepID=C4V9L0_VAIC1|nr:hypothetical protein NCER_101259 [Vairimorpha ceranae BRL01]